MSTYYVSGTVLGVWGYSRETKTAVLRDPTFQRQEAGDVCQEVGRLAGAARQGLVLGGRGSRGGGVGREACRFKWSRQVRPSATEQRLQEMRK